MPLTKEQAQNTIEGIFKKRATNDANTRTLAHTLQSLITDVLSGDKYIGELLQNADDAGSTEISFIMVEDYFIFKHRGKHFDRDDIKGICDAAKPDRLKVQRADQIGNKGIGFKAVFSLASEVSILSQHACFRFDEQYELWRHCAKDYPWQIIPIYTDLSYFSSLVQKNLCEDSLNFVFKLRPALIVSIQEQLAKLSTQHLLFLRHVKKCTIVSAQGSKRSFCLQETVKEYEEDNCIIEKLKVNKNNSWWIYHKMCFLPEDLRKKLSEADNVPEKYKDFESIPISIAIVENKGVLVALQNVQTIFCYLATDLNFNIKFSFNSEFLLDSSRMQLRKDNIANAWNGFILKCMLVEHVKFLSVLNERMPVWRDIFEVLSADYHVPDIFSESCQQSFHAAIKKYPLVTDTTEKRMLTCEKAIVDIHGFIGEFCTEELKEKTVHPEIKNKDLIVKLGGRRFQSADISQCFNQKWLLKAISSPEENKRFINMMMIVASKSHSKDKFEQSFKESALVLDSADTLRKVADVYFPDESLKYAVKRSNFIVMVHPTIAKMDRKWLSSIGVRTLTLQQIIFMANKSEPSLIDFLVCLAKCKRVFSEEDWKHLKTLKVVTENGRAISAADVYLPTAFSPEIELQNLFEEKTDLFCHSGYSNNKDAFYEIREFLLKIGVHATLTEYLLEKIIGTANTSSSIENVIQLTQILYHHYFMGKGCSKVGMKSFKKLKVVCADGLLRAPNEVYLADVYEPEILLQKIVPSLHFISERYCREDIDLDDLVKFLMALGVHETISIELHHNPARIDLTQKLPEAKAYFDYLESTYTPLYSSPTKYYMNQHRISGYYVEISFINQLVHRPYFWEILSTHWQKIEPAVQRIHYKTYQDNTPIISNIHYYVILAVKNTHGKDAHPKDFFGLAFSNKLSPFFTDLPVATITGPLSLEQCATLGFKGNMTVMEIKLLLRRISEANQGQKDFSKISFLYQQLIAVLKEENTEEEEGEIEKAGRSDNESEDEKENDSLVQDCALLARDNEFRVVSELYHITDDYLSECKNPQLIKRPNKLLDEDFCHLCEFFEIPLLKFSDLKIRSSEIIESNLAKDIHIRLGYCVYVVLLLEDLSGLELQKKYLAMKAAVVALFEKINFVCSDAIEIYFEDFLSEAQDLWIDRQAKTIYHLPYKNLDHQSRQLLLEFCCEVLGFKSHREKFLSIMTSPMEKLEQKYEDINQCQYYDGAPDVGNLSIQDSQKKRDGEQEQNRKRKRKIEGKIEANPVSSDDEIEERGLSLMERAPSTITSAPHHASFFPGTISIGEKSKSGSTSLNSVSHPASAQPIQKKEKKELKGMFFSERLTRKQREELGYSGERKVYSFLREGHIRKYGQSNLVENENGYIIQQPNDKIKIVSWLNKNGEQYKPYDFEIIVNQSNGKTKVRHLEVKTTTQFSDTVEVMCSTGEWQQMQEDRKVENKSSRLFVVKATIDVEGKVALSDPIKVNVLEDEAVRVTDMKKLTIRL